MKNRVNFDDYAENYEQLLQEQLAFFSGDRGYFSEYKVALIAGILERKPTRILDFGCGIGLSLPYLKQYFTHAEIYASDLSEKSMEYAKKKNENVTLLHDAELDGQQFDLIFVTGVFHHIPVNDRSGVMKRLAGMRSDKGALAIFEHNPFNPVTRHMVATCPFDEDASLMSLRSMKALIKTADLHVAKSGYCLFFPEALKVLRPVESLLHSLPLGGQYFVMASD